jgi:hypothetical protein
LGQKVFLESLVVSHGLFHDKLMRKRASHLQFTQFGAHFFDSLTMAFYITLHCKKKRVG